MRWEGKHGDVRIIFELYQFSDGQIFNTFASLGISSGIIGLFIYFPTTVLDTYTAAKAPTN